MNQRTLEDDVAAFAREAGRGGVALSERDVGWSAVPFGCCSDHLFREVDADYGGRPDVQPRGAVNAAATADVGHLYIDWIKDGADRGSPIRVRCSAGVGVAVLRRMEVDVHRVLLSRARAATVRRITRRAAPTLAA